MEHLLLKDSEPADNLSREQNTSELSRISILTRIARAITENVDIVRIYQIAIQKIRHYCFCDSIYIFYNNSDSRCFYLTPALNRDALSKPRELSLNYRDTFLHKIFDDPAPLNCTDASQFEEFQPGDRQLFHEKRGSFLAVPILLDTKVLGALLLTNAEKNAFDENDAALVEDVAILIALAIDRTNLQRAAETARHGEARWSRLYSCLLENIDSPVALVNIQDDLIYQTNKPYERLTGFQEAELHGMKLSTIHPAEFLENEFLQPAKDGTLKIENVPVFLKNGREHHATLNIFTINRQKPGMALVLYTLQGTLPAESTQDSDQETKLTQIYQQLQSPLKNQSYREQLESILQDAGEFFQAKYLTVHRVSESVPNPKLFIAHKFPKSRKKGYDRPWIISISEGPFEQISVDRTPLFIENVIEDERFKKWQPIAEKLGYAAFAGLPIIFAGKVSGILTFFFPNPKPFTALEKTSFLNLTLLLAMFIENQRQVEHSKKLGEQIEVMNRIASSINSSLELDEVIRTTVTEVNRILDFDHACITLFDEAGENMQVFTVISKKLAQNLPHGQWIPFKNSQLGWLKNVDASSGDAFANELTEIDNRLLSKINMLLLSRGKYLGTFSVSNLAAHQYTDEHQKFLKQIALQVATAIENARLFEAANRNLTELSALADISKSISASLDIDEVFGHIVKAAAIALKAQICTIRLIQNDKPRDQATSSLPGFKDGQVNHELERYLDRLIKDLKPIFSEDISHDDLAEMRKSAEKGNKYRSFLAMPVISQDQAIAIITLYWEEKRTIGQRELNLGSMIANQAASAIQNAHLYQESIKNSEQLKSANEELENFVYTVSHDLKAPIVSIQGFTSILLHEYIRDMNEEAIHFLERVQVNANQMEKLIRDLLELSRIGRVVNPFEFVAAGQIILEAQTDLIYQIQKKKIELVIEPELPALYCDKNRMVQVFTNLISNAVKYIGNADQPTIRLGCREDEESYILSVQDNGIGIEKQYFNKIFGLFQILESEQQDEQVGTGVGLTIVKRIIENHGGKVWLDSIIGQGTTFYISIPKAKEREKETRNAKRDES